jgi:hypothetical protein
MADTNDELREYNFRLKNLVEETRLDVCDSCLCQKEDCRLSPHQGYFCPECLLNGDARACFLENDGTIKEWDEYVLTLKTVK